MEPYEKLGAFYLGRGYDLAGKTMRDDLILYDSKDLLTHAFCVGMTGSGKTGLCVTLLEEAAIDGIPAIVIDPKGDLTNLMLTFPDLSAEQFRPWINEDVARQKGTTPEAYAEDQAELWRNGLASWSQSADRVRRLRESADFTIYTPGSEAGLPVSILASFAAPPRQIVKDRELLNERISTTATSLLGLLGMDVDPIKSREHILISTVLENAWEQGGNLDLGGLIQAIQNPPVSRIGVLELESFYPAKDRFELAMTLNNLLASPTFETWLTGEPLDIDKMLYTTSGKPRVSIFSIAHLSEAERMFFVSLLFNQTLGWMRTRSGTTSLRALVYMDEIFGYIPPVANPPSKKPLLTLLKQARAYGVGIVLATQNPVDLDYKGLSNTGTWFIGRLQTDRDKQRVLDGLEGASAGQSARFDRQNMEEILSGLGKRVFLMHNVHENEPAVFHTRWALSYLRGPLTRQQIKTLMEPRRRDVPAAEPAAAAGATRPAAGAQAASRPVLPPDVPQFFLPVRRPEGGGRLIYEPRVLGVAKVSFIQRGGGFEHSEALSLLAPVDRDTVNIEWAEAEEVNVATADLRKTPLPEAVFGELPAKAASPSAYTSWKRALSNSLYQTRRYELFKSKQYRMTSKPGESERDFRIRLAEGAREKRDAAVEKLRKRYASKTATLQDRVRRAEQAVDRESEQAKHQKLQTAISFGATILAGFLGRKTASRSTLGRATTAMRGVGRSAKEGRDIDRAKERVADLTQRLQDMEAEFEDEVDKLEERFDPELEELETVTLKPRRTDIDVKLCALAWTPHVEEAGGTMTPAWD